MKRLFLSMMACSMVVIFSCNDNTTAENNDSGDGSGDVAVTDERLDQSNLVTKSGLPLGADQEVPANESSAKGTADITYNKETKTLTYTVNYEGLTSEPNMAHIHGPAPRGENAGPVHDLSDKLEKSASGSFTDSVKIDGTKLNEDSLLAGHYYINIHTPKHPGGEIRGQIEL